MERKTNAAAVLGGLSACGRDPTVSQGKDSSSGAVEENLGDELTMPFFPALLVGRRKGLGVKWYFTGLFYFSLSSSDSVKNKFHFATKVEPVFPLK